MTDTPRQISLDLLDAHSRNPRLLPREDVIEALTAAIRTAGFDPAHAILVRPLGNRFEILSGHHRRTAASRAGLASVPAWVREMDDDTAYMELVRSNAQGELTPLERGMHALHSGMSRNAYADSLPRPRRTVLNEVQAAEVAQSCADIGAPLSRWFSQLVEIHAAPDWLWPALVQWLVTEPKTPSVEMVRGKVAGLKNIETPPPWSSTARIADALVAGTARSTVIERLNEAAQRIEDRLTEAGYGVVTYLAGFRQSLAQARPSSPADVIEIGKETAQAQADMIRQLREAEAARQKAERDTEAGRLREEEDRERQLIAFRSNVSLEEWKTLHQDVRAFLLDLTGLSTTSSFNEQDSDAIEWAKWSWNPVTGCLHDCPYCYARDIAERYNETKAYPHGFAPAFRPASLLIPASMKVPKEAARDTRYRNVFTCSMADLFGRWVPAEWIEAVLDAVRSNPQWNFLFLTKFPKRMSEFDIPENAWMGTTVDLQARVRNAETAFAKVTAGIRWLSVEPMLEPLKFERLDLFQWVVIGGATTSSQTPEWKPPFIWIADLVRQAREAGCKVYFKTNLLGSRVLEMPFDAPIVGDPQQTPKVFHYLGKGRAQVEAA